MTYNVFGGTLNLTLSINLLHTSQHGASALVSSFLEMVHQLSHLTIMRRMLNLLGRASKEQRYNQNYLAMTKY